MTCTPASTEDSSPPGSRRSVPLAGVSPCVEFTFFGVILIDLFSHLSYSVGLKNRIYCSAMVNHIRNIWRTGAFWPEEGDRNAKQGKRSNLHAESAVGSSACPLAYINWAWVAFWKTHGQVDPHRSQVRLTAQVILEVVRYQ